MILKIGLWTNVVILWVLYLWGCQIEHLSNFKWGHGIQRVYSSPFLIYPLQLTPFSERIMFPSRVISVSFLCGFIPPKMTNYFYYVQTFMKIRLRFTKIFIKEGKIKDFEWMCPKGNRLALTILLGEFLSVNFGYLLFMISFYIPFLQRKMSSYPLPKKGGYILRGTIFRLKDFHNFAGNF